MKILVASSIAEHALTTLSDRHEVVRRFGASEEDLVDAVSGSGALVFRSGVEITRKILEAAPELELIVRAGSGYDNIDLEHLATRKLRFVRIPGPGARAVAEMSFALMLAMARRVLWADHEWRQGHWVKPLAAGRLLDGKTLGVIGAGNIGSTTGRLGYAWGMNVLGCVEHATQEAAARLAASNITMADLDTLLERSDFVSIHVPLHPSTQGLIASAQLGRMKPDAFLVNMARGGVVDEAALREALVGGRLAGAALDVHSVEGEGNVSALADLDNVILTPHIGAQTTDSQEQIGHLIVRAVDRHLELGPAATPGTPENFIVI
jgi:D-3-phosphoglycerate dehydrogenase